MKPLTPVLVGKVIEVEWVDAVQYPDDGLSPDECSTSLICHTAGWCIGAGPDGVKVALDRAGGKYRYVIGIPGSYIKRLKALS